ncbi:hypothetical protein KCU85_g3040, partial [Aureobasidium melanogenum]
MSKRPALAIEVGEGQPATRRRQDPVSCQVCRKKKLKCSRTFPCSNCVSRGLECQPPDAAQWPSDQQASSSANVSAAASDSLVLARVLERLQRLEDIVLTKSDNIVRDRASENTPSSSIPALHEDVVQNEIFHTIGRSNASPQANIEQHEDEFRDTEIVGSRPTDAIIKEASFLFTSGKVSEIAFDLNLRMPVLTSISVEGNKVIRRICLPEREEARILFQTFAKSLGSWYHIYHKRTVEILLDKTYYQIACGHNPGLPQVALLISIFASGAYFQASVAWPECVFSDPQVANQLSMNWKQNTLDILDHIERSTTPTTVEQLQATIIMSLMIQNFEGMWIIYVEDGIILSLKGLSKKYWLMHSTSITLAKDLSIHVLDHPRRARSKDVVENEVKRRIWWYLATTDWLLGSMPSPQEGTYSINPRHIHVNKPMNVDDDDLLGQNVVDKPLSTPTEMSYFLVRTHGGEESKTEMPAADRFLTPLMELLRKHKIQLQDAGVHNSYLTPESTTTPNVQTIHADGSYPGQSITAEAQNVPARNAPLVADPDLNFDGLWQEFINMVPDSSAPGWDDLLADFDQASLFMGV